MKAHTFTRNYSEVLKATAGLSGANITKAVSWAVLEGGDASKVNVFENGLDWAIGMKVCSFIRTLKANGINGRPQKLEVRITGEVVEILVKGKVVFS